VLFFLAWLYGRPFAVEQFFWVELSHGATNGGFGYRYSTWSKLDQGECPFTAFFQVTEYCGLIPTMADNSTPVVVLDRPSFHS
jgi:hypothetical protein